MTLHPRWVRMLPAVWLTILLPVRAADLLYTLDTTTGRSTAAVVLGTTVMVSIFGVSALIVIERGSRRPLVALLAVLVFGPYLVMGSGWPEVGGLLCGALLLTVPAPWSWALFVVVAFADALAAALLMDADTTMLMVNNASTDANIGLAFFAVTRLAQLVLETERTRQDLATAEARIDLLDASSRLRTTVGVQLSILIQQCHEVIGRPAMDRSDITAIAVIARRAGTEARSEVTTNRQRPGSRTHTADPATIGVPFRFAWWMLVGVLVCYAANSFTDAALYGGMTTGTWRMLTVITVIGCGLQLYHAAPRATSTEPRWWWWTLALQFVLAVPIPLAYPPLLYSSAVLSLAIATGFIRFRPPWAGIFLGFAAFVGVPALVVLDGHEPTSFAAVVSLGITAFGVIIGCLTMFALCALPAMTRRLHATRDQFTHAVLTAQRVRFARDVHDLLGFHLSAITLTCELASRVLDDDPERARGHVEEVRRHAEKALAEVRTIETSARLRLGDELVSARAILRAAGTDLDEEVLTDRVSPQTDHLLGVIVRESVTNVIRHAVATTCSIRVSVEGHHVKVRVTNDGAAVGRTAATDGGNGLDNLAARARDAGGSFDTRSPGDTFEVTAAIPLQAT